MTDPDFGLHRPAMTTLRVRWIVLCVVIVMATVASYTAVLVLLPPAGATRWLLIVVGLHVAGLGWLWRSLPINRAPDGSLYPTFGPATWVTVGRGVCLAYLTGFLFAIPIEGAPIWLPAILYFGVAAGDYLDGLIARTTDRVTPLGSRLDTRIDSLGILVAALFGILTAQVPVWYLLAGLARYAFVAGRFTRRIRGRPTRPLPADPRRRLLAGLQMAFLVIALLPGTGPPFTTVVAAIVLVPFLLGFLRDWLYVSGRIGTHPVL